MTLHIGLDFDNTIVDYRPVFGAATRALGIGAVAGSAGDKTDLRDRLRAAPDGELQWQRVQAHLYGSAIADAPPYPGFLAFAQRAVARGDRLSIVSHKSRFAAAAPEGPDLRDAARAWLAAVGILGPLIAPADVHFAASRAEKIALIRELPFTHYVDDLLEVLNDPGFPAHIRRVHFVESWNDVADVIFG